MASTAVSIKFPMGRIVQGSLYRLNDRNKKGELLTYKKGPKTGQQRYEVFFALAIPKKPGETHFAQTEWGAKLWSIGHAAHPVAAKSDDFAWKVVDGDSNKINKEGVAPNMKEGFPGHWVVFFKNGSIPRIGQWINGQWADLQTSDVVKAGYWVEVLASVEGNGQDNESPGIYINHNQVCFRYEGPEIVFGPDPNKVGFGEGDMPAGAAPVPPLAPVPSIPAVTAAVPGIPAAVPGIPAAVPGIPAAVPGKTMTAKAGGATYEQFIAAGYTDSQMIEQGYMLAPVTPNPNFGSVTGIPGVPTVPGIPAAVPGKTMTAKAGGATYEQFVAAGYSDEAMLAQGYLIIA